MILNYPNTSGFASSVSSQLEDDSPLGYPHLIKRLNSNRNLRLHFSKIIFAMGRGA